MKKYTFYFFIVLTTLLTSCGSVKSTLKNVDNNAPRPAVKDGHYVITEYSNDEKYGYNKDYPINLGFDIERLGTRNIDYFFNALTGMNGEKFTYIKTESCCPFPTKRSVMGGGILDVHEVTFQGKGKKITLYFNIYDRGKIMCPNGFLIKK
jgi:hypothetical protein